MFLFDQIHTKRYIEKNFYDHKEVGPFLQGKKVPKRCKYRNILKYIYIYTINSIYGLLIGFNNKISASMTDIKKPTQGRFFEIVEYTNS